MHVLKMLHLSQRVGCNPVFSALHTQLIMFIWIFGIGCIALYRLTEEEEKEGAYDIIRMTKISLFSTFYDVCVSV